MSIQDEYGNEIMTVEELVERLKPRTIHCAADCKHGCDIVVQPEENWVYRALEEGWTVTAWRTDPGQAEHGDQHTVVFCDPGCGFTWFRARMLIDPHWQERLGILEEESVTLALDLAVKREEHEHGSH